MRFGYTDTPNYLVSGETYLLIALFFVLRLFWFDLSLWRFLTELQVVHKSYTWVLLIDLKCFDVLRNNN